MSWSARAPQASARRPSPWRALLAVGIVLAGTLLAGGPVGAAKAKALNLSGVSITFGDQVDEYQTIVNATNTLAGAPYKVTWSNFIGGPPIVAAEVGGSVDLGDMAETPVIFAQAAGDPLKVIAITQGVSKTSPYGLLVPTGSSIKTAAELRGKTIAVQEGTVEQYVLVKVLQAAHIPYSAVTIDNLNVVAGEAALEAGKVDAWVGTQPFIASVTEAGKGHLLPTAAGSAKVLGYLTAPVSSLDNPEKAAAITDFVVRLYKSEAILRKDPQLAIKTYVSTYGVSEAVAAAAVKSAKVIGTPITPAVIKYQQAEANTFRSLGLIPDKLNVASVFDLALNKKIAALAKLS
jgi:sulfonate transport system substrate-binding protein